jgi:Skp family chaperone for outer membrane proteins
MTFASHLSGFSKNNPVAAAAVLGAAFIAAAAIHSNARPSAPTAVVAPTPVTVGFVDLARLMNNLQELADRNELTKVRGKQLQDKLGEISTQIKQIDAELKDVIPKDDKAKRIERVAQKFELEATYEARAKSYQRLIDLDHGDILNDLYPKAVSAVQALAAKEGFDIVLLDDRPIGMPDTGTVKDYNDVIQRKRVLFAKDGMDITDQLVTIMNNEYTATMKKSQ